MARTHALGSLVTSSPLDVLGTGAGPHLLVEGTVVSDDLLAGPPPGGAAGPP